MTWSIMKLHCLFLILIMLTIFRETSGSESGRIPGECQSIDIKNSVQNFQVLENCTVINGNLHIVLIEGSSDQYKDLAFPNLVEIKDHLLMYRVYGLRTLRYLFPNLAVIRGEDLITNYAFVIYEMPALEEIGLTSLNMIKRGDIRIEKNPNLCYLGTIEWKWIAESATDSFIQQNKDEEQCVDFCPPGCQHCWTPEDCQTFRGLECAHCNGRFCRSDPGHSHQCCHEECIGGCYGPQATDCMACRNVIHNHRCQPRCPSNTYRFQTLCLLDHECTMKTDFNNNSFMMYMDECVEECPADYMRGEKHERFKCVKCKHRCPKDCSGTFINSLNMAQKLKGCTTILGNIEIQITGGSNIATELEDSLGSIENINEYLRIFRSDILVSLHFFKNLKSIGSHNKDKKYIIQVLDNKNLKELFLPEVQKNLLLENGIVSFHDNRKLCMHKINTFIKDMKLTTQIDTTDVSNLTNGNLVACSEEKLNLTITQALDNMILIKFTTYHPPDPRHLLNYLVSYREVTTRNISIYQDRDACSDKWTVHRVSIVDSYRDLNTQFILELIPNLKPWTDYAIYVQTYMISNAAKSAISDISYIRTLPTNPSPPTKLKVVATHQNELEISWSAPEFPRGNVTHYFIYWQEEEVNEGYVFRDYCQNPTKNVKKNVAVQKEEQVTNVTQNCCSCKDPQKEMVSDKERINEINFEDSLQNIVFQKRNHMRRRRRAIDSDNIPEDGKTKYKVVQDVENGTTTAAPLPEDNRKMNDFAIIHYKTKFILTNLGHFQEYRIEVTACQPVDPRLFQQNNRNESLCSTRAIFAGRTMPQAMADSINSTIMVTPVHNTTGEVKVTWEEPEHPNGIILTYDIMFGKTDSDITKLSTHCITRKTYLKLHGTHLASLSPGNYTIKICANSLAGRGPCSPPVYHVIEPKNSDNLYVIVGVVSMVVLVVAITGLIVWFVAKKKFSNFTEGGIYASVNPEYVSAGEVYIADHWEVDRDKIELLGELGQGSFGMVYEGKAKNMMSGQHILQVAIKTCNENASAHERINFLKEASVMKAFDCYHVVKLLGVVSQTQPTFVIMELMAKGDLRRYLRKHRPDEEDDEKHEGPPPTVGETLQMAVEIADGMAYLAYKKYVHRDLAARNCMVSDKLTVKIGDFGMTRDIYDSDYYRKGGRGLLPVRWMAPESLKDGLFDSHSDVWSFGVVLWEMATLAAQPYQGLSNEEVLKYVVEGRIMERPEGCPDQLYDMMNRCWSTRASKRPSFNTIIEELLPDADPSFRDVAFYFCADARTVTRKTNSSEDFGRVNESDVPLTDGSDNADSTVIRGSKIREMDYKSSNPCECAVLQETAPAYRRPSNHNGGGGGGVSSSDSSKESSSSSRGSYAHMNGVANGHRRLPGPTAC